MKNNLMTQEEKELLIKDLCARLPYGVICRLSEPPFGEIIEPLKIGGLRNLIEEKWDVKPYLRPMSSMTDVEKHIFDTMTRGYTIHQQATLFDWLNKKMFDYRGLIPNGLAIEVNESNNPYK